MQHVLISADKFSLKKKEDIKDIGEKSEDCGDMEKNSRSWM